VPAGRFGWRCGEGRDVTRLRDVALICDRAHKRGVWSRLKVDLRRQPFLSHRTLCGLLVLMMPGNEFLPNGNGTSRCYVPSFGDSSGSGAGGGRLPRRS
jgi:hypothetical protein